MGTLWPKSGSVEHDDDDEAAAGALAYFFVGGTGTTPTPVYADAAEGTVRTHPVVADANGRWPAIFIPFQTSYDVKVTTSGGTQLYFYQSIPNPDPVEASEDSVDDNQLLQPGDTLFNFISGTRTGFVRCNGRTMGNAASGGTERANADTSDLFIYLWNNMANGQAAVSGGRGGSAAADYAANKTITLPDLRGASPLGLDDMGNSTANRLGANNPFTHGNSTTVGSFVGLNWHTLTEAQLPSHTHTFSATTSSNGAHTHTFSGTTASDGAHTHTGTTASNGAHTHTPSGGGSFAVLGAAGATWATPAGGTQNAAASTSSDGAHTHTFTTDSGGAHTHTYSGTTSSDGAHTHTVSGTTGATGSGAVHNNVQNSLLGTYFLKL